VLDQAISLAKELTGKSAVALSAAMRIFDAGFDPDHSPADQMEIAQFKRVLASNDIREGMTALKEERPAFFRDN
jgi:enoyl-CoA hydratase